MNVYREALEKVEKFATMPYIKEIGEQIKKSDCFETLRLACDRAEHFDYLKRSEEKEKWHLFSKEQPKDYGTPLIVTYYNDSDIDDPYNDVTIAKFYHFKNGVQVWMDLCGNVIEVSAWKKLPLPCEEY